MYKLSKLAAEDFAGVYEYTLLNFGVKQADCYTDGMEDCLTTLVTSPLIGRECDEIKAGLRRMDHEYHAIFYRIHPSGILIIRILQHQMEPMKHLVDVD